MRTTLPQPFLVAPLLVLVALIATFAPSPAMAQNAVFSSASGVSCPGGAPSDNVICSKSIDTKPPKVFFEPETACQSLKRDLPTWNEIEQPVDDPNPGVFVGACNDSKDTTPGTEQGYTTYCRSGTFIRRSSFVITSITPIPTATNPGAPLPPAGPSIEPQSYQRQRNAASQPASCGR